MDEKQAYGEVVIKQHPNSTHWLEGNQVKGAGNLILTNERLVFLKQAAIPEHKTEAFRKLSQEATTDKLIQFALTLHKKNFHIPLSSIVSVKLGMRFAFLPNLCMRISYRSPSNKMQTLGFVFKTGLIKRLFEAEPMAMEWGRAVKKAIKSKKLAA